jgi:hypothetical protein
MPYAQQINSIFDMVYEDRLISFSGASKRYYVPGDLRRPETVTHRQCRNTIIMLYLLYVQETPAI